jgi:hydrogenase maturation protein HypF
MLRAEFNCPETSSLGRLFDAVAFLAGYCDHNDTEGQAAMRLEQAVLPERVEPYAYRVEGEDRTHRKILWMDMIRSICDSVAQQKQPELIASRFHETVAAMLSGAAAKAADVDGTDTAVLSGGCFFNRVLTERLQELLRERGFRRVLVHARLSPGDASLSLGQAVVAAARLSKRDLTCV